MQQEMQSETQNALFTGLGKYKSAFGVIIKHWPFQMQTYWLQSTRISMTFGHF